MTAPIVHSNAKSNISSTLLAQTAGGAMVAEQLTSTDQQKEKLAEQVTPAEQQNEKIESSMQTNDEQEQAMIEKIIVRGVYANRRWAGANCRRKSR